MKGRIVTIIAIAGLLACCAVHEGSVLPSNASPQARAASQAAPGAIDKNESQYERKQVQRAQEDDFWWHRVSYPTGQFAGRWYVEAVPQHEKLSKSSPTGSRAKATASNLLDPTRFTALGPKPLNTDTSGLLQFGLVGGRVNAIVTHPNNPNIAWFGSDGGGVWKTTNCCSSDMVWTPKTDLPQLANISIGALVLDPNDPNVIYAGTGDHRRNRPFAFGAGGLLKSSDGGETWSVLGSEVFNPRYQLPDGSFSAVPQNNSISSIALDPIESRRIIVGTNRGTYHSIDGGANWNGPCIVQPGAFINQRRDISAIQAFSNGPGTPTQLHIAVGSVRRTSLVREGLGRNGVNGIYIAPFPTTAACPDPSPRSRPNNGWPVGTASGVPFATAGGNPLSRIDIAAAPSNPDRIYAQVDRLGVFRSNDRGTTWTQVASTIAGSPDFPLPPGCDGGGFPSIGVQDDYNAGMLVSRTNPDVLFLNSIDLWRSTDGGDTFQNLTCGYGNLPGGALSRVHVDQHALTWLSGSDRLLIGNDGGVYLSNDPFAPQPSFTSLNRSTSTIEFYSGDLSPQFNVSNTAARSMVAGAQDNGVSAVTWGPGIAVAETEWQLIGGGDGIAARIEPIAQQRIYWNNQGLFLVASTDGFNRDEVVAASPVFDSMGRVVGTWGNDRRGFLAPFELYRYSDINACPTSGCVRMLAGTNRVWESITGAIPNTSWYAASPDLTKALSPTDSSRSIINAVTHSWSDASRAYVGTNDGNVWFGFGLGQGAATPAIWVNVSADNSVLPNRPVMDVVADARDPLTAYAVHAGFDQNTPTTPGRVFRIRCSENCGSFLIANKTGNLPNIPVNTITVNPNMPAQAFVGTDWGLYFTNDIDAISPEWQRFANGPPNAMVWDLGVDRGFTTLVAFTRSRGAWVWPLPRTSNQPNLTGLWYVPGEDGWGLSMAHQGEVLFPAWYTYDSNGRPIWYLIAGATRQPDGSYSGNIFSFVGTPFDRIAGPVNGQSTQIGSARFREDNGRLLFEYTIGGVTQSKSMTRISPGSIATCVFVEGSRAADQNRSDTWWNPAESGWGVQLTEGGDSIFTAWYTYANDGRPMWLSGLLQRGADGRFTGAITRPQSGTPFNQINGSPSTMFPIPTVGSATLSFSNGERGSFSYTLDGVTQSKPIERFIYAGPTQTSCMRTGPTRL